MLAALDDIPLATKFKELDFTIGYNKSDTTFGWNGFNNALVLYYLDKDEKYISKRHSVLGYFFAYWTKFLIQNTFWKYTNPYLNYWRKFKDNYYT